jgi:acetylornithine/N-succinyldiaminopimelate aminotransferase
MVAGTHGSTYGGNPLALGAAEAVFRVAVNDEFLANVETMAARLRQAIEQMMPNHDAVFDSTRGLGLMIGIKLKDAVEARAFVAHLRDNHGLLTVAAGENVVRILPPLVIDDSHVAECVEKLSAGARTFEAGQ